jgi:hypothetical protein
LLGFARRASEVGCLILSDDDEAAAAAVDVETVAVDSTSLVAKTRAAKESIWGNCDSRSNRPRSAPTPRNTWAIVYVGLAINAIGTWGRDLSVAVQFQRKGAMKHRPLLSEPLPFPSLASIVQTSMYVPKCERPTNLVPKNACLVFGMRLRQFPTFLSQRRPT